MGNFDDSIAMLTGVWGPTQVVQATLVSPTGYQGEVELLLRWNISAHVATGYEINCSASYTEIVAWAGPYGSFDVLSHVNTGCANGDVIKGTITGTNPVVIKMFKNGVQLNTASDTTWLYVEGSPGIGFYNGGAGTNSNWALTTYSADDGVNTLWSGLIDPNRAVDWSGAGMTIPTRTTVCVTSACNTMTAVGSSATPAQINAAIASAASGTVVQLAAGTYALNGAGIVMASNVTLRGMGADQTFLVANSTGHNTCGGLFAQICFASGGNFIGGANNEAPWTAASYTKGATSLILGTPTTGGFSTLAIGSILYLDQNNDTTTDTGNVWICETQGVCSIEISANAGQSGKAQGQMVVVTSLSSTPCSAPCTVGFSPGLAMPNWSPSRNLQAEWSNTLITNTGVEDLSVDGTLDNPAGNDNIVTMSNSYQCWVKGIRGVGMVGMGVEIYASAHSVVRDSYFWTNTTGSKHYGVNVLDSSDVLVENNIFHAVPAALVGDGPASGTVWGYNYAVNCNNGNANFMGQCISPHTAGQDNELFEGNQMPNWVADATHGTGHFFTVFRNQFTGWESSSTSGGKSQQTFPMLVFYFHRYNNLIGNVLGELRTNAVFATGYQCIAVDATTDCALTQSKQIYSIGYSGNESQHFGSNGPDDPLSGTSLFRWGNYDNKTIANRWCGNSTNTGWSSTCSSMSEVPTGLSIYWNQVPATETLPNSLYLPFKPAWFGSLTWPPIGPDVSSGNMGFCNGGTYDGNRATASGQCSGGSLVSGTTALTGHVYAIPATNCYLNVMSGPPNGSGSALTFNAAACYTGSSSVTPGSSLSSANINASGKVRR